VGELLDLLSEKEYALNPIDADTSPDVYFRGFSASTRNRSSLNSAIRYLTSSSTAWAYQAECEFRGMGLAPACRNGHRALRRFDP